LGFASVLPYFVFIVARLGMCNKLGKYISNYPCAYLRRLPQDKSWTFDPQAGIPSEVESHATRETPELDVMNRPSDQVGNKGHFLLQEVATELVGRFGGTHRGGQVSLSARLSAFPRSLAGGAYWIAHDGSRFSIDLQDAWLGFHGHAVRPG
jgi:hypothetical protein